VGNGCWDKIFHARKWGCSQKVCIEGEQKVAKSLKRIRIMKEDKKPSKKKLEAF
jgi:hypothetical protein